MVFDDQCNQKTFWKNSCATSDDFLHKIKGAISEKQSMKIKIESEPLCVCGSPSTKFIAKYFPAHLE